MAQLLTDFLAEEITTQPAIIGRGILPVKSKMILGGQAKANKSFLTLNLALDLAKGRNGFGASYKDGSSVFPITKPWRVLLIEMEIGPEGLQRRLRTMIPPEDALCDFFIKSKDLSLQLDTPNGLAAIEREIDEVEPHVLIIDPLSKVHSSDENSASEMGQLMRKGDYLISKYGISIMFIHHTGLASFDPQNMRRGGARLRGSSAVFADVDSYIEVARTSASHTAEPLLTLNFELRQGAPILPVYVKRLKNGLIQFIGENSNTAMPAGSAG